MLKPGVNSFLLSLSIFLFCFCKIREGHDSLAVGTNKSLPVLHLIWPLCCQAFELIYSDYRG